MKAEARFSELAPKLSCERFTEMHSFAGQQIDVSLRLTERLVVDVIEPLDNLVL